PIHLPGLAQELLARGEPDGQEIGLALNPGKLLVDLGAPLLEGPIPLPEALGADHPVQVEAVGLVHLRPDPGLLSSEGLQEFALVYERPIGLLDEPSLVVLGEEEALELVSEKLLEVVGPDLPPALPAPVLREVR